MCLGRYNMDYTKKAEAMSKISSAYTLLLSAIEAMENKGDDTVWLPTETQDIKEEIGRIKEVGKQIINEVKENK